MHRGTGRVFPFTTAGSAGGKSLLPRAVSMGAIASCQMVAPLPPPKPPTSSSSFGLKTMTLAAISGVYPTKATERLFWVVPVLPAIWCPGT